MISFLKEKGYAIYLGLALPFVGIDVLDFKFYAVMIPTVFLVTLAIYDENKEY